MRRAADLVVCSEATDTFFAVLMADAAMRSTFTVVASEHSDVVMLSSTQRSSRACSCPTERRFVAPD